MLRFDAYRNGKPIPAIDLTGAYAFGQGNIPIRADLVAHEHQISCMKHSPGACGLAIPWHVGTSGTFLLTTPRLPARRKPYVLNVELLRSQMARLYRKQEDWGLFDHKKADKINQTFSAIRNHFIEAIVLEMTDPAAAASLADRVLDKAILLGEKMALLQADIDWSEKKNETTVPMGVGCRVNLQDDANASRPIFQDAFSFVDIPMPWKSIEATERNFQYDAIDSWVQWAADNGKRIHAGPLLCLDSDKVPDWFHLLTNDFDAMRSRVLTHIQRTVERYHDKVDVWCVVASLASRNDFGLSFENITELTRAACQLVKKIAPQSEVMLHIDLPWGEYYARDQRTIPPGLFADLAFQSDMKFDSFGIPVRMGVATDGYYVRDVMQIGSLLDNFIQHGKPIHLTHCGVPSSGQVDTHDAWGGRRSIPHGGRWHSDWSPRGQAEWLHALMRLAASRPLVRSLAWGDFADVPGHMIPHGGLFSADRKPKSTFHELISLCKTLFHPTAPAGEPLALGQPILPVEEAYGE